MHWTRQLIVYLTVLTLLFLSVYSFFLFSEYRKYTQYIQHTYKVLNTTERLEGSIFKLMVLKQRHLVRQENVLKNQTLEERTRITTITDSLKTLVKDNVVQVASVNRLRYLYISSGLFSDNWLSPSQDVASADVINLGTATAKPVTDSIFQEVAEVQKIEEQLLEVRSAAQKESGDIVPLMLLITGLTAISTLAYAFIIIAAELRARLKARQDLEKNVHQLNLANEDLERFTFIAAHNLKEPLRKSRTFISRILPDVQPSDTIFPNLQKVALSLTNLQEMLDDLLVFTKFLHHNEAPTNINLSAIIQDVITPFKEQITETRAIITAATLPTIKGFANQMTLVFHHLLSNSLKFHQPDRPLLIGISSWADPKSGYQIISFSDNGIGFDMAFHQKIFEIFGQLHDKELFEGTGIGLPICRRAMFNHDGYILVESSPGNGARFNLYFPLQSVQFPAPPSPLEI